eukprot:2212849-Amphidinium_carterae.3
MWVLPVELHPVSPHVMITSPQSLSRILIDHAVTPFFALAPQLTSLIVPASNYPAGPCIVSICMDPKPPLEMVYGDAAVEVCFRPETCQLRY